jgi:hypothetical protein
VEAESEGGEAQVEESKVKEDEGGGRREEEKGG